MNKMGFSVSESVGSQPSLPAFRPYPEWPLSKEEDGLKAAKGVCLSVLGGIGLYVTFIGVLLRWAL